MNLVHTYYEPVHDIAPEVQQAEIAVWRESWQRWGWQTKVLGRDDVKIAPDELARLERLPSVNPPGYDMACYLRWFAMRAIGGGLLVDYDVVNVGLPEAFGDPEYDRSRRPMPVVLLSSGRVPCAVGLTPGGADDFCRMLLSYDPGPRDLFEGRPHVSDMTILQGADLTPMLLHDLCHAPQHAEAHTRLLHVSHHAMDAMGLQRFYRHDVMAVLAGLHSGLARR